MIRQPRYFERIFWRIIFKQDNTDASIQIKLANNYISGTLVLDVDRLRINGALHYYNHGNRLHITHLGSRKKGTGTALINYIKKSGKTIELNSKRDSVGFYEKLGFKRDESELRLIRMVYTPVTRMDRSRPSKLMYAGSSPVGGTKY